MLIIFRQIWDLRLRSSEKSGSVFTVTNAQKAALRVRSAFILSVTATVHLNLNGVICACYPIFERQASLNRPYFQMPTVIHLSYVKLHCRSKIFLLLLALFGTENNISDGLVLQKFCRQKRYSCF